MAIVAHEIQADQETRDLMEINADTGSVFSSELSRYFIVYDEDRAVVTPDEARYHADLPQPGFSLDGNPLMLATSVRTAARGGGGFAWVVEVGYTSVPYHPFAPENITETWTSQPVDEPIDQGYDGSGNIVPIMSGTDETYDPPLTREFSDLVLTRGKNVAVNNTAVWSPYLNKVSNTPFRGFQVPTALCRTISLERRTSGQFSYWRLTFQVHFRSRRRALRKGQPITEHGWNKVVLHQGFRYKVPVVSGSGQPTGFKYETVKDKDGMPVASPVPLWTYPEGQVGKPPNETDSEFKQYILHERIDLNGLDAL